MTDHALSVFPHTSLHPNWARSSSKVTLQRTFQVRQRFPDPCNSQPLHTLKSYDDTEACQLTFAKSNVFYQKLVKFLRPITRSTVLFVLKASRWHWTLQLISTHFNVCWWHDCARLLHVQPMQLPPRSLWDIWNLQEDLVPSASWSGPWLNCRTDMATRCHCKVTRLHTNRASHFPWGCEANGKEARVAWVLTEPSIIQLKPSDTFGTFPYLWNPPEASAKLPNTFRTLQYTQFVLALRPAPALPRTYTGRNP